MTGSDRFEPHEIDALARFARGFDLTSDEENELGEIARRVVSHVRERNGSATVETIEEALRLEPTIDYESTIGGLLAADSAVPIARDTFEPGRCPPLPDDVVLDAAIAVKGTWVDQYVAAAHAVSPMTPSSFNEAAALALGGIAIARRLVLPMSFANVFPNLFVAWVAPSTVFRKTTALDYFRRLARAAVPHLLTAQESTPEAFLTDLAGREPPHFEDLAAHQRELWQQRRNFAAQRGLVLDEFSSLPASAGRDYNTGLLELYLRAFDCTDHYERITRGQGLVMVKDAYLSLLGASTPSALGPHLTAHQLWANGWWPRFALLCPEDDRPAWSIPTAEPNSPLPHGMADVLRQLDARLPQPSWPETPTALTVRIDRAAFELWQPYAKALTYDLLGDGLDDRLFAAYGRLPNHALKVATIFAALEWPQLDSTPRISAAHMMRAMMVAETWRSSVHRLLEVTVQTTASIRRGRLVRQIAAAPSTGLSLRDIWRRMRDVDVDELRDLVDQAIQLGEIEECPGLAGPKGGRPSKGRYRIPRGEVSSGTKGVSS